MTAPKYPIHVLLVLCLVCISSYAQQKYDIFSNVNSPADEQHPVLSPDGQHLYFTRANEAANAAGVRDKGDIWYSERQEDQTWSEPKNLKALNNANWNGVIGFSADGNYIYLIGHYSEVKGVVRTQGISRAKRRGSQWGKIEDIKIPYFKNLSSYHGGHISADGEVLLLSLESYGTKGGEDIYVCFKGEKGWSDPKNLGNVINSKFQEFTPYLSMDKKTLYFSSNGRRGKGSSDVYKSERLDDTWTNWSQLVNLSDVNSDGREQGYKMFGELAIYTSTTSSDGYGDIRLYTQHDPDSILDLNKPVIDSISLSEVPQDVVNENPNEFTLFGKVFNAESHEPIQAEIIISEENNDINKAVSVAGNTNYSLNIESAGVYTIRVDAPGYISHQETLDIFSQEVKLLEMNFDLQPIKVGTKVNLENVLFKQSTSTIIDTSYPELLLVVDLMKENPSMKIRLEGHTDNRGLPKNNMKLSKERAKAVLEYLKKKGISARRMSWKGYGGTRPIADNNNSETRKMNRRVEFTIVKQ